MAKVRLPARTSKAWVTARVRGRWMRKQVPWPGVVSTLMRPPTAAVSLLMRLLDRSPDPASSRDHVFLSVLAERRQARGRLQAHREIRVTEKRRQSLALQLRIRRRDERAQRRRSRRALMQQKARSIAEQHRDLPR